MKYILLPLFLTFTHNTGAILAQSYQNKYKEYSVIYLLHLKFYEAWPRSYEKAPKHSPIYVLSLDTLKIKVNDTVLFHSPGLKRRPGWRNGINVSVVEIRFPKGDSIHVNFKTSTSMYANYSLPNRSFDTSFTIKEPKPNDFYFLAHRPLKLKGRTNSQFTWRLFDSKNTRKQLAERLKGMLEDNIVHRIVIE
jgi:hypothetical protein